MNKHTNRIQPRGTRAYIVMASLVCLVLLTELALAGTRQFLVILADSPKEARRSCEADTDCRDLGQNAVCDNEECSVPCASDDDCSDAGATSKCVANLDGINVCAHDLVNPEIIRRRYFEDASFAEYWEEISYGDIKINGKATEWLSLPWPISLKKEVSFVDLNGNERYNYGAGELFDNTEPMVRVDLGRGVGTTYANGGQDTVPNSSFPVWMPGERFLDVDGDGIWDGLDEATNQMDFFAPCGTNTDCAPFAPLGSSGRCIQRICIDGDTGAPLPDGLPDLLGPWIDFNGNGIAEAPAACIYLPDSDNDGNPDCCPNGPGTKGCEPFTVDTTGITFEGQDYNNQACPAMTWPSVRPDDVLFTFNDCNGNLIPDECDVSCVSAACQATGWLDDLAHAGLCGTSRDELPRDVLGDQCEGITTDDTPDECQFVNFDENCIGAATDDGPCGLRPVCEALGPPDRPATLITRCEYHDSNGNGALDIVEPFENFLHGVGTVVDSDYKNYVRANYPGHPDRVIAQADPRVLLVRHDPLGKLPLGAPCLCNAGTPSQIACTVGRCNAGEHVQYDPPDLWVDEGSAKVQYVLDEDGNRIPVAFPAEPSWYKQAWIDRYGTAPPNWNALTDLGGTPRMESLSITLRGDFFADRGGTNGDGTGALADGDCGTTDVDFRTDAVAERNFVALCDDAILPEQLNGIEADLIFYDGPLEHDDLPSSKYHRGGDQALGEVTSPFHNNIWGDGGVAGGPYATGVHGNFGRPAGNVLHMELLSLEFAPGFRDTNLDRIVDQGESKEPGGENYVDEPCCGYPNNHERLIEDCIAILDDTHDFDDFVDPIAMAAVECVNGGGRLSAPVPGPLSSGISGPNVNPSGILSGIVLLPSGSPSPSGSVPSFRPIHNEDGLGDPNYVDTDLPRFARIPSLQPDFAPQINWNIFVHSLVLPINGDFQVRSAANGYLQSWEDFPTLFDPDVIGPPGAIENCPIETWDIMAFGRLVHSIPILKEKPCTEWIVPVDLATLLTPGVDATLTLPRAEFVRDNSYFFLENEDRLGERSYFWSAGEGLDRR
ncbi:MAG: hypothetical protein IIC01_09160, partial [Planctomycetes bacterium]|nr:hypothetical protein [Planctomycetota bacterium]